MVFPAPIKSPPYAIESQWIDYNGHFNMAFYNVLFDRDSDVALALVGLGPAYVEKPETHTSPSKPTSVICVNSRPTTRFGLPLKFSILIQNVSTMFK